MNDRDHMKIANAISQDGIGIGGDEEPHGYALTYSIGRYENGWPELAIWTETKEDQEIADSLLLSTANRPVHPGDRLQLRRDGPAWIAVPQQAGLSEDERLHIEDADEYYGRHVPVLILLPELDLLRAVS